MGMHSTTQAFQLDVPFEQLFQLAIPAAQSVPKATVTFARPQPSGCHLRHPDEHDVLGREHRRRFYSLRAQHHS